MLFGLISIITLVFFVAPLSSSRLYELKAGTRGPVDKLVGQKFVRKRAFPMKFATAMVTLRTWRNETIFEILATDLKINGKGAVITILRNGLGYKDVTLKLRSQWCNGIDYHIRLYGHFVNETIS
ncbi:uncharacterized protein LOC117169912 [Belonocnema kinseyi]|uniref:uncharacterized protein LOC117169912 n=1 Tax=Belonocnema kinseyi TaxID=2817044 RepID=UPI00143D9C0E|nr:uncharacterized protein LOC117169912 [Belonocnema kinseyi]